MIDNYENLSNIAKLMGVSTAFVSSVLTGKKNIPETWFDIFTNHYDLDDNTKSELYNAYCEEKNSIKIDVDNIPLSGKKVAVQFQRTLPGLSEEELTEIWNIIGKNK